MKKCIGLLILLVIQGWSTCEIYGQNKQLVSGSRIVLVTGSTSGLGREVARALVNQGDHVILHGRNMERGTSLQNELNRQRPNSARFYATDFGSLVAIKQLAESLTRDYERLDVLVNNAGIALIGKDERYESKDGYELHFQVNYLAGYYLTDLLMPLIEKGNDPRIVNVASGSAAPLDFDNLMLEEGYNMGRAYGQSKLAQVMYTMELSEDLKEKGIAVNALHPSSYMDTNMIKAAGLEPMSSVMDGRDAVMQLINEDVGTGLFFNVMKEGKAHDQAYEQEVREKLWEVSKELIDSPSE